MNTTRLLAVCTLALAVLTTNAYAQDKVQINNNTGATLIGLFMSLNDLADGDPDWEENIIEGEPLENGEQIDVEAFEGENCETYVIGVAANGDWWYVEQDTCQDQSVDLAKKGPGKKATK